jgi:hypothetical protein
MMKHNRNGELIAFAGYHFLTKSKMMTDQPWLQAKPAQKAVSTLRHPALEERRMIWSMR